MRYLTIIPARGGSKGVVKKNIKDLNGLPLIQYTIDAAKDIFNISDICVTSDSTEILSVASQNGLEIPFTRPRQLATDTSGTYEVLLHALNHYENKGIEYDAVVLLQPTSPLRTSFHIKEALDLFSLDIDMVVSVCETKSNPYYVLFEEDHNGYLKQSKKGNFTRRQDCPEVWELNGAIYVINVHSLKKEWINDFEKIVKYEMSEKSSIDIDTDLDFKLASLLLTEK